MMILLNVLFGRGIEYTGALVFHDVLHEDMTYKTFAMTAFKYLFQFLQKYLLQIVQQTDGPMHELNLL